MTRPQLEKLGLEKETIDSIMVLHGANVEKSKTDVEALNETIKAKDEAIAKANETIKSFEGVNVEDLNKKIKDYEVQTGELQVKHDQEIKDFRLKTAIKEKIIISKAKNADDIMKLYDHTGVSLDEKGNLIGFDDTFKPFQEARPFLFEGEADQGTGFKATSGQSGGGKAVDKDKMDALQAAQVAMGVKI